jgi:hypothetical protein
LKPFWPLAFPWHPPELHACFVKIGTIWLGKLIGRIEKSRPTLICPRFLRALHHDALPSAKRRDRAAPVDAGSGGFTSNAPCA